MKKEIKIIGYVRESTMKQINNGYNLEEQTRKINEYCNYYKSIEYSLEIVQERGVSARSLKRPQIKKVIEMIENRKIDILIIHNLDRLTRSVSDLSF